MEVRLASHGDAEAIRAIYNAEVVGSTVTFDLEPRTAEEQRRLDRAPQGAHPAVVAVDGGTTVIGFGSLSPFRDRAAYATTVEDSLYVDAASAGPGGGPAPPRGARGPGRGPRVPHRDRPIVGDNEASTRLHRACGFVLVGVEREVGRKFGRWIDVAILQRML